MFYHVRSLKDPLLSQRLRVRLWLDRPEESKIFGECNYSTNDERPTDLRLCTMFETAREQQRLRH